MHTVIHIDMYTHIPTQVPVRTHTHTITHIHRLSSISSQRSNVERSAHHNRGSLMSLIFSIWSGGHAIHSFSYRYINTLGGGGIAIFIRGTSLSLPKRRIKSQSWPDRLSPFVLPKKSSIMTSTYIMFTFYHLKCTAGECEFIRARE